MRRFGVDDGGHGVEFGEVREEAVLGEALVEFAEGEGRGDRHRLGDAARLDEQVVEAAVAGEPGGLFEEVVAEGAADAAVAEFDQALLGAGEAAAVAHEVGVDVDLAHVVDDDRHAQAFAVAEHVVEQRGLARAEEAREDRDRQFLHRQPLH
jgi:hypothetical protein